MLSIRAIIVMLMFGAVGLAGCIGGEEVVPPPDDEPEAEAAQVTETTGAISGEVVSDSFEPIQGAEIDLLKDGVAAAATETDRAGQFTINGVEPGDYIVQVTALLHKSFAKTVTIEKGAVSQVPVVLETLPTTDPWQEGDEYTGLMSVGAEARAHPVREQLQEAGAPTGLSMTWSAGDSNHQVNFSFDVQPEHLETLVVEVYWNNEAVGLRANVWQNPNCSPCRPDKEYARENGFGEIKIRVDRPEEGWDLANETEELQIFMWPESTAEQPVVVAYQQPYTVYWEAWYREPAPEGHVIRADA